MQFKTMLYKGASIYYMVAGSGPVVVLLHGFGETSDVWKNQIEFLSPHFQLIVPDIPGSGKSAYINNADIDTYADILKNIVAAELAILQTNNKEDPTIKNKPAFALIGHSMGGYIALAFAEKYPDYLNSLGLFHSSAFADSKEKKEMRKKAIDFITANGAAAFLKSSIPGLFTKAFASKNGQQVDNLIKQGKNFSRDALIQYYTTMCNRPDRRQVLENFKHPILFLIGEWDTAVPLQVSLQQSHLPAQSYVNILELSAHMGLWEEVEKTNTILFQFLYSI